MTREEFNAKVREQFKEFEAKEMTKSPAQIFADSYEISKMESLKDYLIEEGKYVECCYPYADTILENLYEYEWNYDTAQWINWEDITNMIHDFIKEKEN